MFMNPIGGESVDKSATVWKLPRFGNKVVKSLGSTPYHNASSANIESVEVVGTIMPPFK
jgi:hypothetical protein